MLSSFIGRFGKFGNLLRRVFADGSGTDESIVTVKDGNNNVLADTAIQIKRGSYTYTSVTDSNGQATLVGALGVSYVVTLAKADIEQYEINGWIFTTPSDFQYPQ